MSSRLASLYEIALSDFGWLLNVLANTPIFKAIRSRGKWGHNMIPNNHEYTWRQLCATYRLILLRRKRGAQRQNCRSTKLIMEIAAQITSSRAMQDSNTTGISENG